MYVQAPRIATEIQLEILGYLAEDARHEVSELVYGDAWRRYARLLLPAILVNRDWAIRGTDLLWREPFTPALARIPLERRQLYADKIQSLGLYLFRDDHINCPAAFAKLSFPKLKRLELNSCPPWLELDLRPYLSSSITSFTMRNCRHLPNSLLEVIAFCCPKLLSFNHDYIPEDQDDQHLLRFLQKSKYLREIVLRSEVDEDFPEDILENLVARKQLRVLEAPQKSILYSSVLNILQRNPRLKPFRNLRNLCLSIESRAVAPALSAAETLIDIRLDVIDSEYDIFGAVGCLPCLEVVDICFYTPKSLTIQELLAISGLTRLRELSIYRHSQAARHQDGGFLIASAWNDDSFESWIGSYPHLEKLHFGVRPSDSHWIAETSIIARNCPNLTDLIMRGMHDIGPWKVSPQPLFPKLEQLELGQLKPWPFSMSADETAEYTSRLAHMIRQHAPKLTRFDVGEDDFGAAVARARLAQERIMRLEGHQGF